MRHLTLQFSLVCCIAGGTAADTIFVSNASEINAAMASAQPGDQLVMTDGNWTNQTIRFEGNGAAGNPITLRAQTPGDVILNGSTTLEIAGSHLVVDGLYFKDGVLGAGDHVVQFRRGSSNLASNCVLRNTVIENVNNPDIEERFFWVSMYGTDNTVEACRFDGFVNRGVTLVVWGDWPNRHTITNNHFVDRPEYTGSGSSNGFETMRIGTSDVSSLSSQSVVHNNLFERCDGEAEIISNKTYDNSYTQNTFRQSKGTLTLRHGGRSTVEGNFFLGDGVSQTGGVRIIGPDQTVRNNYFENLDGRAGGVIVFEAAQTNPAPSDYEQVDNAIVTHNTVVNCTDEAFKLDNGLGSDGRTELPINTVIADNAVSLPGRTMVQGSDAGITWVGNQFFGGSLGISPTPPGITLLGSSPLQLAMDGLYRPGATSTLPNAASSTSTPAADMDGQPRDALPDVGADEVSVVPATTGPLFPEDVGPDWSGVVNPPMPGGLAQPAENFALLSDPDGDGDTWAVVNEPGSLTGQIIKAPTSGGRVDLPSDPHDALARYDVMFEQAGTYTLYVRSRGFNGSSDSFFAPDALGVEPDVAQTSTQNGSFRWDDPTTIQVVQADLGQARSIWLGKREGDTEIDAIVLSTDAGLSDSELDDLVLAGPACLDDLNDDGNRDFLDYAIYMALYESDDPAADLDGNGVVDSTDHDLMVSRIESGCP